MFNYEELRGLDSKDRVEYLRKHTTWTYDDHRVLAVYLGVVGDQLNDITIATILHYSILGEPHTDNDMANQEYIDIVSSVLKVAQPALLELLDVVEIPNVVVKPESNP